MRLIKSTILSVFLFFALTANIMLAQDTRGVSEPQFEELKKEIDYSKTRKDLKLKEPKKRKEKEEKKKEKIEKEEDEVSLPGGFGLLGGLFQIIAYIVIAVLALAIIYLIFSNIKIDKKLALQNVDPEARLEEEEHIEDIDVQTEFEKALASGNYRLALRMRFIEILQELSLSKRINWRHEKTNRDYARELSGSDIHQSFRNISHIFEWVWYGNQEINREQFDFYSLSFDQFKKNDE